MKRYASSPDASNTDRLIVAVRYVDENNVPNERILEMKETWNKTGEGLEKEILYSINHDYLFAVMG